MNRYAPGPWFAVVTETALVLLPADVAPETVERVWATLSAREGFGAALDAVTGDFGTQFALIPSFAIVVFGDDPDGGAGGDEARIAVRGPLAVHIEGDAELGQLRVSGARVTTWSESVSTNPASIEIVTDAAGEDSPLLPIQSGVVRCASVVITLRESEPAADALAAEASDALADRQEAAAVAARTAPDPEDESASAVASALGAPVPRRAATAGSAAGTPQASVHRPVSARSHTNAAAGAGATAVQDFDADHDGETISVEQMLSLGRGTPVPVLPSRPVVTPVLAGVLVLSSGGEVLLDRGAIIGRKPSVATFRAGNMPHLVTVPSPQQDISRSHVEVRCEGVTVFAVDLGTTNGTRLLRVGQAPARLTPQEPLMLVHGDVLDLGDEVHVTFVEAL